MLVSIVEKKDGLGL